MRLEGTGLTTRFFFSLFLPPRTQQPLVSNETEPCIYGHGIGCGYYDWCWGTDNDPGWILTCFFIDGRHICGGCRALFSPFVAVQRQFPFPLVECVNGLKDCTAFSGHSPKKTRLLLFKNISKGWKQKCQRSDFLLIRDFLSNTPLNYDPPILLFFSTGEEQWEKKRPFWGTWGQCLSQKQFFGKKKKAKMFQLWSVKRSTLVAS